MSGKQEEELKLAERPTKQQDQLTKITTLPTEMKKIKGIEANAEEILEDLGVKFLGQVEDNNLFQYVQLPKEWEKVPSERPMWQYLLDEKKRKRVEIFYKAKLYDRKAFLRLCSRFGVKFDYNLWKKECKATAKVTDQQEVVNYSLQPFSLEDVACKKFEVRKKAENKVREWLDENYPGWKDPRAYRN